MEFDYREGMEMIRYPEAEEKKYPRDQGKGSVGRGIVAGCRSFIKGETVPLSVLNYPAPTP
jgi:hypothetical protein